MNFRTQPKILHLKSRFLRAWVYFCILCILQSLTFTQARAGENDNISVTLTSDKGVQTHLSIPREYISPDWPQVIRDGSVTQGPIILDALLPDLKPIPREARGIHLFSDPMGDIRRAGNYVNIWLLQGTIKGSPFARPIVKSDVHLPDDPDFPGFDVYTIHYPPNEPEKPSYRIRDLLPKDLTYDIYISYVKDDINPNAPTFLFDEHLQFNHMMYGQFSTAQLRLPQWKSLTKRVQAFVDTLIVPDQKEDMP